MTTTYRLLALLLLTALLSTACSTDDQPANGPSAPDADVRHAALRLTFQTAQGLVTRAPGDPAPVAEPFQRPRYIYVYVALDGVSSEKAFKFYQYDTTTEGDWQAPTVLDGDSIYSYFLMGTNAPEITTGASASRLYVAASNKELPTLTSGLTEAQVKEATFSFSHATDGDAFLRDLYSTPANLKNSNGDYYAQVRYMDTETPAIDVMLYHVATRLDLLWNVPEDKQADLQVSQLELLDLKQQDCYLFKPMGNTAKADGTGSVSYTIDVGEQWYGRHVFYVVPWFNGNGTTTGSYPLTLRLTNRKTGKRRTDTSISIPLSQTYNSSDGEAVFAPWVRLLLNVKNTDYTED